MGAAPRIEFLASVRSEDEARTALAGGAGIIDCKEPANGALGACPHAVVTAVRRAMPAAIPVSATIGDLPCQGEVLAAAACAMAATGADYVKVGFFPGGDARGAAGALGAARLGNARLVAVLFADLPLDLAIVPDLAGAGFAGVMLDTAGKGNGALVQHRTPAELGAFVQLARDCGLMTGLAGSLRAAHLPALAGLRPDVLGFRGALCSGNARDGALDAAAVRAIAGIVRGLAQVPHAAEALAS